MLRQRMHSTNLSSVSNKAKYWVSWLPPWIRHFVHGQKREKIRTMETALALVILCNNRWLKIEVTAQHKSSFPVSVHFRRTPHNSHQTSLSPASQPSSADSSGSKENRYELNQQSKQAKRISEHAINVKRALRQRLERSSSCDWRRTPTGQRYAPTGTAQSDSETVTIFTANRYFLIVLVRVVRLEICHAESNQTRSESIGCTTR